MPDAKPDPEPDENPYHIPLPELTGRHGYARQRGADDDEPLDPGAPVAYVAEHVRDRPSALTIEGMIRGIGDASYNAAKQGGASAWTMRLIAAGFVLPILLGVVAWTVERF